MKKRTTIINMIEKPLEKTKEASKDKYKKRFNIREYVNMMTIPKSIDHKAKIYVPFEDRIRNVTKILSKTSANKLEEYPLEEYLIEFIESMYENKSQMKEKVFSKRLDDELSCLDELGDYLLFCKGHEYSQQVKGYKCLSVSKFQYHDNDGLSRQNYRKGRKHNCVCVDDIQEIISLKIDDKEFVNENTICTQTELIEEHGLLESVYKLLDNDEEKEIVNLFTNGCRTADICRILNLTESKVNTRVERIRSKLAPLFNRDKETPYLPATKVCRKCESELPLYCFGEDTRNKKDGRKSYCKECINAEKRKITIK